MLRQQPQKATAIMQICNPYEIIIQGITNQGKTFRPSDWSERLSGILSSFNTGRLSYHQYVRPLLLDEVRCVAVDKKLAEVNPPMYEFLLDFAGDNDLRILDCKTLMQEQESTGAPASAKAVATQTTPPVTAARPPAAPLTTPKPDTAPAATTEQATGTAAHPVRLREILPPDTGLAFAAMQALRPNLASAAHFVGQVDNIQRPDGYRLVGIFTEGEEQAVAVCGFRLTHNLAWGRYIYIDDVCTLPQARKQGYATQLLQWVNAEARRLGCSEIHLNADVSMARNTMHRLCLNNGYRISSHHFRCTLSV